MIVELAPDYDLFVKILFVVFVFKGVISIIVGISQADKPNRDKYGIIEVLDGGIVLVLALWVICG